MQQHHETLEIQTHAQGFSDITHAVQNWIANTGIRSGLCTLLIQHTSASLTIQENADPDVLKDLTDALHKIAPDDLRLYRHTAEGPDDMPAHIKSALTSASLSIPILNGRLRLGTWQGIYLIEHRTHPHLRHVAAHVVGD